MYDDVTTRNESGELAVRTVSATEGSNTSSYDDVFTRTTDGKLAMRVVGEGGGGGGAVSSVNGKTGAVVLNAEDVGALPEDTPIPDPQVQSDWNQTDPAAVDYIKNKPVIPTSSGVPQYDTLPTASADNVGEIAQYSGETIPDVPASAVATQTVGSGLSDLAVNVDTFIEAEQPIQSGNYNFVANVFDGDISPTTFTHGDATITINPSTMLTQLHNDYTDDWSVVGELVLGTQNGSDWYINILGGGGEYFTSITVNDLNDYGITISGSLVITEMTPFRMTYTDGHIDWEYDNQVVDLAEYGITYSGIPVDGDTISVAYTPLVAGITNGYFYKSSAEYSDPSATISQTVGSSLTDLSVNVDTFVEAEQPTQSGNTSFVANVIAGSVGFTNYGGDFNVSISYDNLVRLFTDNGQNIGDEALRFLSFGTSGGTPTLFFGTEPNAGTFTITPSDFVSTYNGTLENVVYDGTEYSRFVPVAGSTTWSKNGTTVDLAEYGVSYSGTPVDGDTLTVTYTAPTLIGYSWKQTDVQPSSGGGSAGIEWQEPIIMTKPAGDNDFLAPYVHLGSESGSYSFYVKVLRLVTGNGAMSGNNPFGYMIYKISFDYDSTSDNFYTSISKGSIGLVFDGDMPSNFANDNPIKSSSMVRLKRAYDGTLWVSPSSVLQSDAFLYMGDGQTEEIAQFSKVYKDGKTINAECFVDKALFWETIGSDTWTDFSRGPLVEIPARYYRVYGGWSASDINSNTQMMIGGASDTTEIYVSAESNEDRFVGKLYRKNNNDWEQEILIASGNFASWEFKKSGSTTPVIYFGENASTFTDTVYFNVGAFGVGNIDMIQLYFDTSSATSIPMVRDGKSYRLLTPSASMISGIHQYIGPTNANYTNGYYYKANGTVVVVPASITTNVTSPAGEATVTIDVDNFVNALNNWYGWSKEQIIQWLKDYWSGWNLHYDIANNIIDLLYLPWQGYVTESSILQYVSVTYTGTETTDMTIIFDETYAPESKVVQNPSWDRVNVQPLDLTGVAGYDATKTQVLKNVQGTLTWVDE